MNKNFIRTALLLAATAPLFADSFNIKVDITTTNDPSTILPGPYQGLFTTGTCPQSLCTISNGGITSFNVSIPTASAVTSPGVLVFDAIDSHTLPQYNTSTGSLSGLIDMTQIITASSSQAFPSGTFLFMDMSPTILNAPPACAMQGTSWVGTGCVMIACPEGPVAYGTYTIVGQPAAGGCPATIGFWKHHPFPDTMTFPLKIGGISDYSKADLLTILNNNGGNAVVILGRQLVGAIINLAAGGVHNPTADLAITTAQSLLEQNGLDLRSSVVAPSSSLGQSLVAQSTILDKYNNADFNTCREGSGLKTGSK